MFLPTQSYKGTRDFYPEDKRIQIWIFNQIREVVWSYGYQEYDGPMLESFDLYAAKSGAEIVNQQLYSFVDRGDRKVAIRPEMTPTLARMVAAKLQELPKPVRWFSVPNLWRYERPQRGRLREHWQLNVDVLGGDPLLADIEILTLALAIFKKLGATDQLLIRVNNRRLVDHFFKNLLGLNDEKALQLGKLIDAKDKMKPEAFDLALSELGLETESRAQLERFFKSSLADLAQSCPCPGQVELGSVMAALHERGFQKQIIFDPRIMRGLDYYTGTVFEAFDISPENPRALFGGGRYDNLIGLFGKSQLSGMGFGMGDVTLRNFLETHKLLPDFGSFADVLVTSPDAHSLRISAEIAAELRSVGIRVVEPLSTDGFSSQMKLAAKLAVQAVVLIGADELKSGVFGVKELKTGKQVSVPRAEIAAFIQKLLSQNPAAADLGQ